MNPATIPAAIPPTAPGDRPVDCFTVVADTRVTVVVAMADVIDGVCG